MLNDVCDGCAWYTALQTASTPQAEVVRSIVAKARSERQRRVEEERVAPDLDRTWERTRHDEVQAIDPHQHIRP